MRIQRTIPLCVFNRHEPVRHDVTWDGLHYIGSCSFCGESIRRKSSGKWLRDWMPDYEPTPI